MGRLSVERLVQALDNPGAGCLQRLPATRVVRLNTVVLSRVAAIAVP